MHKFYISRFSFLLAILGIFSSFGATESGANTVNVTLAFETDIYPTEVSWEILDANGVVIFSGGDYTDNPTLESIDICLDEACYTFRLIDSFGDGWGSGNTDSKFLEIRQEDGLKVVILDEFSFGDEWTADFCVPETCEIEVDVEYEGPSAPGVDDAAIYISLSEFIDGSMYSIDAGLTFQESPLFINLVDGQYEVEVQNGMGCPYSETINLVSGINDLEENIFFSVSPNPTFDMLQIHIDGYEGSNELDITVLNQSGQKVSAHKVARSGDGYRTSLSMNGNPAGLYFVSLQNDDVHILRKFIKK